MEHKQTQNITLHFNGHFPSDSLTGRTMSWLLLADRTVCRDDLPMTGKHFGQIFCSNTV